MRIRAGLAWLLVSIACLCAAAAPAAAEPAVAVQPGNVLIRFDTASPGNVTTVGTISGLGGPTETVRGIDVRPATGQLYAVTASTADTNLRTYTLDPNTGVATFVGSAVPLVGVANVDTGLDFNPTTDRIRYVNENEVNQRINPDNGARILAGDNALSEDDIIAVAHDRNMPGQPATTAYAIDRDTSNGRLVRLGAVDGGSGSANPSSGIVNHVADLDIDPISLAEDGGFDIAPGGTAYAALAEDDFDDNHNLYRINLAAPSNGPAASSDEGQIGNGAEVLSLAILHDADLDGVVNSADNCPAAANPDQANLDGDPQGDACDEDDDGDGISDAAEAAFGLDPRSGDSDGDGVADGADLCPRTAAATGNGCNENPPLPPALAVTVDRLAKSIKVATLRSKGISFRVEPNMAASFLAELVGNKGLARKAKAGDVVLGEAKLPSGLGRRTMRIRVSKSQRRRLKAKAKLTVRITATDGLGRVRVVTRTVRLR